jgi:hypothetical protein
VVEEGRKDEKGELLMKGQKKIIGCKIVSVQNFDEYIVATLDNGMEIEIASTTSAKEAESNRKFDEKCDKWERDANKGIL